MDVLELGGNIHLSGFDVDRNSLTILKKMIGQYARNFSDNYQIEKLALTLEQGESGLSVYGIVLRGGKEHAAQEHGKNLFFVLDLALKKLESSLILVS